MDNLTHSIIATAVGTTVFSHKPLQKHTVRVALVSAFLAFMPDLDFVLRFVSKNLYALEHRGFTHSILGMFFMVPLGAYIARYFLNAQLGLSYKESLKYSFAIWFFGHIVPDFFTIYGVQLLYPFNHTHFDYTLTFIIDVVIWAVGLFYMIFYFKKSAIAIGLSKAFLIFLTAIYVLYSGIRFYAIDSFEQKYPTTVNVKYTPVIHPFLGYNVFGKTENSFIQVVHTNVDRLPLLGKLSYKHMYPYMPLDWVQDSLPSNGVYSESAKYLFKRYQQFGISVLCKPIAIGARCVSLKYRYPSVSTYQRQTKILERIIPFE